MSLFAAAFAVVSKVAGAVSTDKSKEQSKRARAAQLKANKLRRMQAKRQFLRDFRQAQASIVSSSVVGGVDVESSRIQQQLGSQRTQAGVAGAEFKEEEALGMEIAAAQNKAARYSAQAANYGAVSQFSAQFASFGGGGGTTNTPRPTQSTELGAPSYNP